MDGKDKLKECLKKCYEMVTDRYTPMEYIVDLCHEVCGGEGERS